MSAQHQPNIRRNTTPVSSDRKPPLQAEESGARDKRAFEGRTFVGFEIWFLQAIRKGCTSLAERNLIDFIAECANEREMGNPFGRTAPLTPKVVADAIGCSTQNLNCSAKEWFGPKGIFERIESGSRAHTYQIRRDFVNEWLALRVKAKQKKEADRRAEEPTVKEKKPAPFRLPSPVRIGPGRPFKLPAAACDQIRVCNQVVSRREGEITLFEFDGHVLRFDFEAASAASRTHPPLKRPIDKSTCRFNNSFTENKELPSASPLHQKGRSARKSHPPQSTELELWLRAELDRKLMQKCGGPIDDEIFSRVLTELGPLDKQLADTFLMGVHGSVRKIFSWPFLVTPSATAPSIATRARIACERQKELDRPRAVAVGSDDEANFEQAQRILAERAEYQELDPESIPWAEDVVRKKKP